MVSKKRKILVTGAAGFIGSAIVQKLLFNDDKVIGLDNLNNYYDTSLKKSRINEIQKNPKSKNWSFSKINFEDYEKLNKIFNSFRPNIVLHLGAQAGVRYSLVNPKSYIDSNLVGFANILELCKEYCINNLIYASSSSVYGANKKVPFCESDNVNYPVNLYAATKRSNELMAISYSHLFNLPSTGLRFFTVYGPWGRPDMAPMLFTKSILNSEPIKIFNHGMMKRDFTYIDDITEAIFKCTYKPATPYDKFDALNIHPDKSKAPHRIFNIGYGKPIELMYFIDLIEKYLGLSAKKEYLEIQPGEVLETWANTSALEEWVGYSPKISFEEGIKNFLDWYLSYYMKN